MVEDDSIRLEDDGVSAEDERGLREDEDGFAEDEGGFMEDERGSAEDERVLRVGDAIPLEDEVALADRSLVSGSELACPARAAGAAAGPVPGT